MSLTVLMGLSPNTFKRFIIIFKMGSPTLFQIRADPWFLQWWYKAPHRVQCFIPHASWHLLADQRCLFYRGELPVRYPVAIRSSPKYSGTFNFKPGKMLRKMVSSQCAQLHVP